MPHTQRRVPLTLLVLLSMVITGCGQLSSFFGDEWSDIDALADEFEGLSGVECRNRDKRSYASTDPAADHLGCERTTITLLDKPDGMKTFVEAKRQGAAESAQHLYDTAQDLLIDPGPDYYEGDPPEPVTGHRHIQLYGDRWHFEAYYWPSRVGYTKLEQREDELRYEAAVTAIEDFHDTHGGTLEHIDTVGAPEGSEDPEGDGPSPGGPPLRPESAEPTPEDEDPAQQGIDSDLEALLATIGDSQWGCSEILFYPAEDEAGPMAPEGTERALCDIELQVFSFSDSSAATEYQQGIEDIAEADPGEVDQVVISTIGEDWALSYWVHENTLTTHYEFTWLADDVSRLEEVASSISDYELVIYPSFALDELQGIGQP